MKNSKFIVSAALFVLVLSAPTLAKSGTISTTKAGTISTTRTGTISTTAAGTTSSHRAGTISTTRTGIIPTTRSQTTINSDRSWFVELLLTVFGPW